MKKIITIFLVLAAFTGYSQSFSGMILKTKPVNIVFGNPGVELECRILNKFSITADIVWVRIWYMDRMLDLGIESGGRPFNVIDFPTKIGFKMGPVFKYYLGSGKNLTGFYFASPIRYKHLEASDKSISPGGTLVTTRQILNGVESGLMFGYQQSFNRFTVDVALGGLFLNSHRKATLNRESTGLIYKESKDLYLKELMPHANLSVGFRLMKSSPVEKAGSGLQ